MKPCIKALFFIGLLILTSKLSAQDLNVENVDKVLLSLRRTWEVQTIESKKWPDHDIRTKKVDLNEIEFLTDVKELEEGKLYLMWKDNKFLIVGRRLTSTIYYEIIELTSQKLVTDMYIEQKGKLKKTAHLVIVPANIE